VFIVYVSCKTFKITFLYYRALYTVSFVCVLNCDLQGLIFEQFTVNMLNLMRSILRCEAYTPAKTLEGQIR